MEWLREIGRRHQRLKERIHATRIPLGPRGRFAMGTVYLVTPIVAGYYVMQLAVGRAEQKHSDGAVLARERRRMDPGMAAQQDAQRQELQRVLDRARMRSQPTPTPTLTPTPPTP